MADFSTGEYPTAVYGIKDAPLHVEGHGTACGFIWKGEAFVTGAATRVIGAGCYFSMPFDGEFHAFATEHSGEPVQGFVAIRLGFEGLIQYGGPVEDRGRLRYIDGCSDTLLIAPWLRGDPCFNLLHFPAGIDQTAHTHPTIRCGLIHGGRGYCHTATGTEDLLPGRMFILYPDAVHAFATDADSGMDLTVYHPDTDFGPTHEDHPMLNRTIVDGVSAKNIDAIRTKDIKA